MSDYDTDIEVDEGFRPNDYSDKEDDNDSEEKETERKNPNNDKHHDGLSQREYDKLKQRTEYKLSDCCQRYYTNIGYVHQNKFNLSIQDMTICIHCYISYSIKRFTECKDLSKNETECLRYYIDNFTDKHDAESCQRVSNYGKCLLCEAKLGIKPSIYKDDETKIEISKPIDNVKINDIDYVSDVDAYDSDYEEDFILEL